jgi:tetratricopeptide (TPR) repeat protein/O-antigen ligase
MLLCKKSCKSWGSKIYYNNQLLTNIYHTNMQSISLFDKVAKGSLYAVVSLLPLWFLPFTQNILIYQKQALLVVLVLVGLIAWLAKAVNQGEIRLRVSLLYIPAFLLLLVAGISTLLSQWVSSSFWGWPLDITDNFVTLSAFILFSFLAFQVLEDFKQLFRLLLVLLVSCALGVLYALLQAYGLHLLPFSFAQARTFNTLGNMNGVAVFAAVLAPLALTLAFVSKLTLRWILWATTLVLLGGVILLNFKTAWIVLITGLLVLLAFGMWNMRKRAELGWISFPMALIIIAVFFLVFSVALPGAPRNLPIEISLNQDSTWSVAKETIKERPLFGGGPGTFVVQYTAHRPAVLNQGAFFDTRFSAGASEILGWLVTKGIVGLLLLLGLIGVLVVVGVKALLRFEGENFSWMLGLGTFASLVALVVSQFLYPSSFMLWFLFWVLLGAFALAKGSSTKHFTVAKQPFFALAASFLFLLILIFGLGLLFIGGQKYAAEVQYLQGSRASSAGNVQEAIALAANLNPAVDIYWRDLAQLYLAQLNEFLANRELGQEERQQLVQTAISNAVGATRAATRTAPANVANWNVQGFVYRSLIGVEGAETLAQEAYLKAAELEPQSPFPWTELARSLIVRAQNLTQQQGAEEIRAQALQNALENLETALKLKSDYAPAHYLIAVVYEQQGKTKEAVAKLEETKLIASPNDIGLAFQLGVLYWQRKELDKAQAELKRAIGINPNYSNARYILGLVYDAKGDDEAARGEFLEVQRLNPENEEIAKILANLQSNRPVLEGIQVSQPPIQQTPPEIQE